MSKSSSVPRLDLAPKLKRPLSLWNPLDYLRLLYWVFYFPQALRWYVDRFGGGYIPRHQMTLQKGLDILRKHKIQQQLLLQGFLLALLVMLIITVISIKTETYVPIQWFYLLLIMMLGLFSSIIWGITWGVILIITLSTGLSLASENREIVSVLILSSLFWGELGMVSGLALGVASNNLFVALSFAILRPDDWLIGLFFFPLILQNKRLPFPYVTPLPIPLLYLNLKNWLRQDWENGLKNVHQIIVYTLQLIPVTGALNQVLAKTPSQQLFPYVAQLARDPHLSWTRRALDFASTSLIDKLKSLPMRRLLLLLPEDLRQRRLNQVHFVNGYRLDTPSRAVATGFWYLNNKRTNQATEAFSVVRSLPYGEEMYTLAQALTLLQTAQKPEEINNIQVPNSPPEPLLRPTTWKAINSLKRVVEDTKVVKQAASRSARSFALNRAIGELRNILDNQQNLPEAERALIVNITKTWKNALEGIAADIGEVAITKPVSNPYVIGNPVLGKKFVGREDVMRQLEELWVMGDNLQSVVLYGHRRMGKTSILRNFANYPGANIQLIYINLQELGDVSQGLGEVLLTICDEIASALQISPPDDDELLKFPQRTFKRYLREVIANLNQKGLIIALDEFETIEELIEAGQIPANFMGFLRGLVQMSPQVAFAFAGLHTLEEMTADYFQPFFASIIPIPIGFLKRAATRQILANPGDDFLLNYTGAALDKIHALTSGQPYLLQLVGFQLVRRYNDYVFEQGYTREAKFTVEDVEEVVNNPEFYQKGRYYFEGVWKQAAQGTKGQQEIITLLAPHPEGLSKQAIAAATDMEEASLEAALQTLMRHDVIGETDTGIKIMVELFRRWAINNNASK